MQTLINFEWERIKYIEISCTEFWSRWNFMTFWNFVIFLNWTSLIFNWQPCCIEKKRTIMAYQAQLCCRVRKRKKENVILFGVISYELEEVQIDLSWLWMCLHFIFTCWKTFHSNTGFHFSDLQWRSAGRLYTKNVTPVTSVPWRRQTGCNTRLPPCAAGLDEQWLSKWGRTVLQGCS